ncbi:DUF4340 domain-containing protein [Oligoflexaceae bacterium]|nr:DUF4340 domain-containing protein [Oligoflexaceae bacterium]
MRSKKVFLGFLLILLGLGVVAYWDEKKTEDEDKIESSKNKIADFEVENVVEFLFEANGEKDSFKVSAEKVDGVWLFKDEVQRVVEKATIQNVLQSIKDYRYEKEFIWEPDSKAEYGLEKPVRTVAFLTADTKRYSISIGGSSIVGNSVYLSVNDEHVYSGPQYILNVTDRKKIEFRDRKISDFKPEEVVSIDYSVHGKNLFILEKKKDKFRFSKPGRFDADQKAVSQFLSDINTTEVKEYIDLPPKKFVVEYLQSDSLVSIKLKTSEKKEHEIEFSEVENSFWSRKSDGSFGLISDSKVRKMVRQVMHFRNRKFLSILAKDIKTVVYDGETFQQKDGQFMSVDPDSSAEGGKLANTLYDILSAEAEDIINAGRKSVRSLKLNTPKLIISFKLTNGKSIKLKAWQSLASADHYIVEVSDRMREVFKLPKSLFSYKKTK